MRLLAPLPAWSSRGRPALGGCSLSSTPLPRAIPRASACSPEPRPHPDRLLRPRRGGVHGVRASITERGQLQVLRVRPDPALAAAYIMGAGSRRLLAVRRHPTAIPEIACVIVDKDRHDVFVDAFVENFQRVNRSHLETLLTFARMKAESGRDHSDVA